MVRPSYRLLTEQISFNPARWPVELCVISKKIEHIGLAPKYLESFDVNKDSIDSQVSSSGFHHSKTVYDYHPELSSYFVKSSFNGKQCENMPNRFPHSSDTLTFESRFESGNLEKAVHISDCTYHLYLRNDLYTKKHNQWYYFMVGNTKSKLTYHFTIMNLMKPDSLYNMGMKPLFYSEKNASLHGVGWIRNGYNISYRKINQLSEEDGRSCTYSLKFSFEFPHDDDVVYFAHCYPYTYTKLQRFLQDIQVDESAKDICQIRILGRSLAGNNVYMLTISSPENLQDQCKKKVVILSARVHPGETNSSYVIEGIINYLISNSPRAQILRQQIIFKIIPMLNPDGVIVGNSRCSLSGRDLNRCYHIASKTSFPAVFYTKQLLRRFIADEEVIMYCDIHGHSRKQNVFMYGCEGWKSSNRNIEQLFPLMFYNCAPDYFYLNHCHFKVNKGKEGTARVVAWHMGLNYSYTIEVSMCGSVVGSTANSHFSTDSYDEIGQKFCIALFNYCSTDRTNDKFRKRLLLKLNCRDLKELADDANEENNSKVFEIISLATVITILCFIR